ncbi:thioredoxin domain-containing protein 15-like protein, partial [Leptotrombidium deliense]
MKVERNLHIYMKITLQVKLVNSSVLMDYLKAHSNTTKSECVLVMFYYRWCVFSTNAAVYYNALARIYPQLHVLAIDAYIHNRLTTLLVSICDLAWLEFP